MPADGKVIVEYASIVFEFAGIIVIVGGLLLALARAWRAWARTHEGPRAYEEVRSVFGRSVLLGLEILVAADIIRTVAVDPTVENLLVLGMLVVIRTFLSWSLDVELEGMWPWQKRRIAAEEARAARGAGD